VEAAPASEPAAQEEAAPAAVKEAAAPSEAVESTVVEEIALAAVEEASPAVEASPASPRMDELLEKFDLEDEVDALAENGIKKKKDLDYVDDAMIKEMKLSPVAKAKLSMLQGLENPNTQPRRLDWVGPAWQAYQRSKSIAGAWVKAFNLVGWRDVMRRAR
jgi:hypothetical protein